MTDHQLLPCPACNDGCNGTHLIEMLECETCGFKYEKPDPRAASPSIPEGYALVPIKATLEMHNAAALSIYQSKRDEVKWSEEGALVRCGYLAANPSGMWSVMIAAAPQPPQS